MSLFTNVFLCVSNDMKHFKCKEFESFKKADEYFKKYVNLSQALSRTNMKPSYSTMIECYMIYDSYLHL